MGLSTETPESVNARGAPCPLALLDPDLNQGAPQILRRGPHRRQRRPLIGSAKSSSPPRNCATCAHGAEATSILAESAGAKFRVKLLYPRQPRPCFSTPSSERMPGQWSHNSLRTLLLFVNMCSTPSSENVASSSFRSYSRHRALTLSPLPLLTLLTTPKLLPQLLAPVTHVAPPLPVGAVLHNACHKMYQSSLLRGGLHLSFVMGGRNVDERLLEVRLLHSERQLHCSFICAHLTIGPLCLGWAGPHSVANDTSRAPRSAFLIPSPFKCVRCFHHLRFIVLNNYKQKAGAHNTRRELRTKHLTKLGKPLPHILPVPPRQKMFEHQHHRY